MAKESKGTKQVAEVEVEELSPLSIIKTEANLAGLPFFALSRQNAKSITEIRYAAKVERGGRKLDILWKVSPNITYGCPGPFDRKVHKAIEYMINEQGIPIENPILFSIYEIIRILGLNPSGRVRHNIKQSLLRIFSVSVASEGTFYSKAKKRYISDNFHIYDRVVFKEQTLPNGEIADTNYLFLNQWYLDSINAFYVRPIDFDYLRVLQSDIAGRLYELLSLKFYGVISNNRPYWKVEYNELCDLLPITPQRYVSLAKRCITPAHEELIHTRFFSKVVWDTTDKSHWYIFYYPGKKAIEEIKPKATQEALWLELPEQLSPSQQDSILVDSSDLSKEEQALFFLLRDRKIGEKSALEMVKTYPERIKEKIEIFDWAMQNIREKIQSPAGFLRRMIEEDWEAPEGFVSEAEQKKAQEEARKRTKAQKQRDKEEHFQQWCSMTPQQKVKGVLWIWEHRFAREHARKPTVEEMKEKERELIANLPSTEEYSRTLFGDPRDA